ncbi:MAG: alpha-L-arabinofuranosidase C-terminal domain-containing protein [Fimbriimonas sp.]
MTISLLTLIAAPQIIGGTVPISIDASKTVTKVSPSLYGIFFEEINQAGDGGIYAELIRNRGLEGTGDNLPTGWQALEGEGQGSVTLDTASPLNEARRRSLKIERTSQEARFGAVNLGFWGVPLQRDAEYKVALWVRGGTPLDVALEANGKPLAQTRLETKGAGWQRIERTLKATGDAPKARLVLSPAKPGTVWVAYASVMPKATWKNRPNGLRKDLAEHVAGMKPAFVRFPGGCYIEGGDRLADRFNWKASLGPVHERGQIPRGMWGYPTTYGLGYHEYLQWCEDLGAEPMFVASAGMSHRETVPMDQMDAYVQEALDAIEYANGPVTSKWGALRAKNGHPKPFKLKYVEIGNENGGPNYHARYALIANAIGKRYPDIVRIAGLWGGYPTNAPVDLLDEHYYSNPAFFWNNAYRYDTYDRKGPKIYVGEYAVTQQSGTGNLDAALAEAAFMVGMERNSDIVRLSSYAPLFVNVNNRQWNPNAIVFDASRSYGTPSYHVQALFANHRPDRVVQTSFDLPPAPYAMRGHIGLQTWRTQAEFKDIQVTVDGETLNPPDLRPQIVQGTWRQENGVFSQTEGGENRRIFLQNLDLTNAQKWEVRLKARKTGGDEGFIVMFGAKSGQDFLQWNVGGWDNTQHAFERTVGGSRSVIAQKPGKIESNRWYDVRLVGDGPQIRAYLDGQLIQEMDDADAPRFTALAGVDDRKRELVVKVVNGTAGPVSSRIDVAGLRLATKGTATVLQGSRLDEENAFDAPLRIAPRTVRVNGIAAYTFPPRSMTILRVPIVKH